MDWRKLYELAHWESNHKMIQSQVENKQRESINSRTKLRLSIIKANLQTVISLYFEVYNTIEYRLFIITFIILCIIL